MDRFQTPVQGKQYPSEYDIPSDLLADLLARDVATVVVQTLNLATAGTFVLTTPGRGFVPYFWRTSSSNKARVATGIISVFIGTEAPTGFEDSFPAKHNRGFRGTFSKLYLSWNAQSDTSVDFVIHRSKRTPWMTDDSTQEAGAVLSVSASAPLVSSGGQNPNISEPAATNSVDGYLTAIDHAAFSAKQPAGNYITDLTGDGTADGPGSVSFTLTTVNAAPGIIGDASHTTIINVNGKGLVTQAVSTLISIAESQVTNLVSDLAGKQAGPLTGDVTTIGAASSLVATANATLANLDKSTGVSIHGTNTNNNAATGYFGEQVSSYIPPASAVSLVNATAKTVTSITLSPGDWDITAIGSIAGVTTGTVFALGISTVTDTLPAYASANGDSRLEGPFASNSAADFSLTIPSFRVSLSTTTTYYMIARSSFTVGSGVSYGRLSARRPR